jgi:histidyl-tRNA synthetase
MAGREARNQGLYLAEKWRNELPNWRLRVDCGEGGFKNQFKRADKSGATIALILGDDELASQTVTIKYLREERVQEAIAWEKVVDYLNK